MVDTKDVITPQTHGYDFLSSESHYAIVSGWLYPTAFHMIEAAKFRLPDPADSNEYRDKAIVDLGLDILTKITEAPSVRSAKQVSNYFHNHVRPDWPSVRDEEILYVLRCQAEQHPYIKAKLIESGDAVLETSSLDIMDLGESWMELRRELREEAGIEQPLPPKLSEDERTMVERCIHILRGNFGAGRGPEALEQRNDDIIALQYLLKNK